MSGRSGQVRVAYDPGAVTARTVRERIADMGYGVVPDPRDS